jgi:hypothetical protein
MSKARLFHVGLLALSLLLLMLLASIAWAGSSDGTVVDWSVLSSGGAPAAGGSVMLNGTLGQTATGSSSGTGATAGAGFWYGLGEGAYEIFLPVVLRNYG